MAHTQHPTNVDLCELRAEPARFESGWSGGGAAVLTPDSDQESGTESNEEWSDYLIESRGTSPLCASGDDLDDDEAYFLEDEDDDDEDVDDDYDDIDDDDDEIEADSEADSDDEDL